MECECERNVLCQFCVFSCCTQIDLISAISESIGEKLCRRCSRESLIADSLRRYVLMKWNDSPPCDCFFSSDATRHQTKPIVVDSLLVEAFGAAMSLATDTVRRYSSCRPWRWTYVRLHYHLSLTIDFVMFHSDSFKMEMCCLTFTCEMRDVEVTSLRRNNLKSQSTQGQKSSVAIIKLRAAEKIL